MHSGYVTFLCVVEQQTISAAADLLHSTQPTITRQIQQLERYLGVPLFDRVGKRLILTSAGMRVYRYARELIQTETRMRDELGELTDPEQGIVRIGAGLTPTIYRLPSVLGAYRQAHPGIRFQVVTGSSQITIERLRQREIDIAIVTTSPVEEQDLEVIPLWRDELSVVVSSGHELAGGSCTVAELSDMPMVLMRRESGLRRIVEERLLVGGQALNVVLETDSLEAINRFVQAGLGVAVMPWSSVRHDVVAGKLSMVSLRDVALGARTITALVRQGSGIPAAASAFLAALPTLARQAESDELS
ncbi:LysR family transcriptional regulator [Alicyclobacillus dauci]|uniref:LysR family transcriptional regulator n=1 Tax=Alicyclobacillus dauci TaxID=1475485 RepID=A0ABY6Z7E5_9BACL|nr:LysR family transcriptional regulator [Alicyclobacillus dauci]WAH38096.1 LysR family transcriptional regulator [Alicyclobacillus dauci]